MIASTAASIAQRLVADHAARVPFAPFAAEAGIATLAAAYEVQRHYVQQLSAASGAAPCGYKIGLTSARMQAMCGIDTPVAGTVLAHRVHRSGATLARADHGRLGIEFEIAVRLGRDLGGGADAAAVAAAVDAVTPAIEVVDDRGCDYARLDVLSLVADNAWNAGIVLGDWRQPGLDLAAVRGVVFVDDASEPLDSGHGSAVLGHPFAAVTWLANHLSGQGGALRAGEVVMTGSIVTTKFPQAPGRWRYAAEGLGDVVVTVT